MQSLWPESDDQMCVVFSVDAHLQFSQYESEGEGVGCEVTDGGLSWSGQRLYTLISHIKHTGAIKRTAAARIKPEQELDFSEE